MKYFLFAAAFAILLPTTLFAGPAVTKPVIYSRTVHLGDLNLERSPGAVTALQRIRLAAGRVCGPAPLPSEFDRARLRRACVVQVTERGVRDLNAPRVTAEYYGGASVRTLAAN